MPSSRVPRLPRWPSSAAAVVALLLAGCSEAPPQAGGSGSSTTADTTGPGPAPLTSTSSPSSGVVDDTRTSGEDDGPTTGEPQSCCTAHSGAGCDDPELAKCVCEAEAFCCAFDWDDACVELAAQCGGCGAATTDTTLQTTGEPEPPPCCTASEQPGCPEDPGVEACVCKFDAFCCEQQWDAKCVGTGLGDCGLDCMGGGGGGGDCCMPHGGPECDDVPVNDCVCELDPYCCDEQWDEICVSEAQYACTADCGLPPPNLGD